MSDEICEECRVGRYQAATVPYMHWLGKQMLMFPDAPAFVCDVCKDVRYDTRFLNSMDYVLARLAHSSVRRSLAQGKVLPEERGGWQPSRR